MYHRYSCVNTPLSRQKHERHTLTGIYLINAKFLYTILLLFIVLFLVIAAISSLVLVRETCFYHGSLF